jgi:hypothetical protein
MTLTPRQDPVAGVGAEVGGAGLVYPQRVFQQQPDHRRRPQGLRSPVSVGGRDQGARPLRSSKARKATSETPQSGLEIGGYRARPGIEPPQRAVTRSGAEVRVRGRCKRPRRGAS